MLYPGRLTENRFNFAADLVGPLQRGCFGQLQIYIEESLVLIGQKTGRNLLCEKECRRSETKQDDQSNSTAANEDCRDLDISVSSSTKKMIEPARRTFPTALCSPRADAAKAHRARD